MNTLDISLAILVAKTGSSFFTEISINSVSSVAVTLTLFFNTSSSIFKDKLDITFLITLSLFTSLLYVETNFEFNVTSVVVIDVEPALTDEEFVASNKLVFATYLGFTHVDVYIMPITAEIATTNIICIFFSQNICNNSFKSSSSIIFFSLPEYNYFIQPHFVQAHLLFFY